METLQTIKPKTLSVDKFAYLNKRDCLLDFGTSRILLNGALDSEWPQTAVLQKHLFNNYLEEANQVDGDIVFSAPNLAWNIIPINLMDVGVFNSITSAGEDLFWYANVKLTQKLLQIKSSGLTYFISHDMAKILEWIGSEKIFSVDYSVFYYLNQMFKKVTKTKPQNMLIGFTVDEVWITNESKEFYIIIPLENNEFKVKGKTFDALVRVFENKSYASAGSVDRIQFGKTAGSLFKHLTKCLDDKIEVSKAKEVSRFNNQFTKVYICEAK